MTPRILDPLTFPLRGSQLVEASAGTGKTYTISALFLRLVLGHGGASAGFGRELHPSEILVVTFTEAATQELRDRVRQRLAEGAAAFGADPAEVQALPPGRDLLHDLRAGYPSAEWPACARRLQLAAEAMDEAAISTIHGWCHRMLREHAFDSGSLLAQTLQADGDELLDEAVRDWWRCFVYPLPEHEVAALQAWWPSPREMKPRLQKLLPRREDLDGGIEPAQALREARTLREQQLAEWKQPWRLWSHELLEAIESALAAGRLRGQKLGQRRKWLQALALWAGGDEPLPALSDKAWERLTPAGMREAGVDGQPAFTHPALEDLATLRQRLGQLPDGRLEIERHALAWVAARLAQEKSRRAEMGFDDLLAQLDAALRRPGGERLAQRIRAQFPVALIDEFQDTDAVQYRIFDTVYAVRADAREQALVLIGDPKQAIYSFRGADIHSYLAARADTAGRHRTLGTNFRSSREMVEAVNHLFARAEQRPGPGAFLFGGAQGNPLPFLPVQARGRAERWWVDGQAAPALTCWWAEDRHDLADACAAEVLRLLQLGQAGRAGFLRGESAGTGPSIGSGRTDPPARQAPVQRQLWDEAPPELRPVRPGDMAVLVNNGVQARQMRQALERVGVRSVYLSDQDSVYGTDAAADLQRLLQACAEPEDERLLRAALGCGLLGLDWQALEHLNLDELAWEAMVQQFRRYREQWRRQGVLPMLRRLLHEFEVPHRLLARGDERQLTDVLHLAELLQQASGLLDGEHALVRHLAQQRADPVAREDSRIVRLESDADLLKVVTVHKSKGLEYPLVFLPFGCAFRALRPTDAPLSWHEAGERRLALQPDAGQVAAADQERLAEDLRKLYVALTRARFATWIGLAPVDEPHRSGLGCLLGGGEPFDAEALRAIVHALPAGCPAIAVQPAPARASGIYREAGRSAPWAPDPPLPAWPHPPWWVASYSRLRTDEDDPVGADEGQTAPESAAEATFLESAAGPGEESSPAAGTADLHGFPRGASPGSFLHGLLETVGRQGFAQAAQDPPALRRLIEQRCRSRGWTEWVEPLHEWLRHWLATPLRLSLLDPAVGAPRPVDLGRYQVEMEFWFASTRVDARRLDRLVSAHTLGGAPRRRLQAQELHGMFKGYIDLVFEHQGRWWVADYKSNALGERDADYGAQALQAEVLRQRYELQYALYLFALHRHLRSRLPDYDYDRHVGGAVYLFLRGHAGPVQGLHLERPPRALMEALDALFAGEELTA